MTAVAGEGLRTVVHVLGKNGRCKLCDVMLPWCPKAVPGEMVGVTTFNGGMASGYRIGGHNREARCDGEPATGFRQRSLGPESST